jgi:hypothetical protein
MVDGRLPLLKCHFHNGSLGLVQASWRDVIASLTGADEEHDRRYYWDQGGWEGLEWEEVRAERAGLKRFSPLETLYM